MQSCDSIAQKPHDAIVRQHCASTAFDAEHLRKAKRVNNIGVKHYYHKVKHFLGISCLMGVKKNKIQRY